MSQPKRRRRLSVQTLLWFLPSLAAVAMAGAVTHPLTLIPLLLANALCMAASCHAMGFDLEPGFARTVLRRGATYLVLFTAYTVLVFALVAWPMLRLHDWPGSSAAMVLVATLILAMAVLWRLWPAFGLVCVWDDAYPIRQDGSWIFTAAARSVAFGRHLSREERVLTHFLPTAIALLVLAFGAIALAGLYGVLPTEMRTAAMMLYGVVVLPLGCLVIVDRTLNALLRERCEHAAEASSYVDPCPEALTAPDVSGAAEAEPSATATADVMASAVPGTPVPVPGLLEATREGDIERALALVAEGADVDAGPPPGDRDQRPVLMLATLLPDTRLLRALIAKGADVNRASGGITPLLAATRDSWHGRAEGVLTLLANGADPLLVDGAGNSPLHGAVLSAEPGVAAMLLDAGAPINVLNVAGDSPLSVACHAANWPLVEFLLERGAATAPAGGMPALVAAAGVGDDDATGVKLLLKQRAPVDAVDGQQRSALAVAAAEGHVEIVRVLSQAHAKVNVADARGSTPLMEAARAGAGGIVQLLVDAGADIGARDALGRNALTLACQSPHAQAETVRVLLAHDADPRLRDPDGRSALDHAAAAGRWDLVALLDPQTPLPASLSAGLLPAGADTPAHLLDALRFGHWAIASTFAERVREWSQAQRAALFMELTEPGLAMGRRWLLEHGLDPEARLGPQASEAPALAETADHAPPANAPPAVSPQLGERLFDAVLPLLPGAAEAASDLLQAGASPAGAGLLAIALSAGTDTSAARALALRMLEAGADPFGPDGRGRSPLHLAAAAAHEELLQTLLRLGCNPNLRDGGGRTPLFVALEHGAAALPMVRALIAHGADPEAADVNGETPRGLALEHPALERWLDWRDWVRPPRALRAEDLPAAAGAGALPSVQRLLELGFAVDARDAQGATALLRACGNGHAAVVDCLLDAGADATLAAHSGATPLVAAVSARQTGVIAVLLGRGVDVDQRLPNAATALMVAAALGYPEIVEVLLDADADVNAVDDNGRNALHAAAQFSFEHNDSLRARRLFDTLLKHGADVNLADATGTTPLLLLLGAHMPPGCNCDATHIGALLPLLLDAGAHGQHADQRGVTALHACAMHALVAPSRILLAHGAERTAVDGFSRTAADVARQLGYVDVAQELAVRGSVVPSVRQTLRRPAQPAD
jgi:ankyrin repeat protein